MKPQAIAVLVVNDHNEVLLIKRGQEPFRERWALISGTGSTRKGLPPKEAAKEEISWDIQTGPLGEPKFLFYLPSDNKELASEVLVFMAKVNTHKIKIRKPFVLEYAWANENNIEKFYPLAFEHGEVVNRYFKRQSNR